MRCAALFRKKRAKTHAFLQGASKHPRFFTRSKQKPYAFYKEQAKKPYALSRKTYGINV
jgi:hypothetical protein